MRGPVLTDEHARGEHERRQHGVDVSLPMSGERPPDTGEASRRADLRDHRGVFAKAALGAELYLGFKTGRRDDNI
jgi:hypothetical protein